MLHIIGRTEPPSSPFSPGRQSAQRPCLDSARPRVKHCFTVFGVREGIGMGTGAAAQPGRAGARGPIGRKPALSPTGYRVSDRRRFELRMAGLFTGQESLQDVIDLAVTEFLDRLRERPGFVDAVAAAEREQQRRAGIHPSHPPG